MFTEILQYLIYAMVIILILIGIRYFRISILQRVHHPEEWIHQFSNGEIPPEIHKAEKGSDDKIRLYNLWFQVRRIRKDDIPGDFAELGVYQGESAYLIHKLAPERTFHLFDTFSGFSKPDLSMETGEAATYDWHHFADTDPSLVKEKLGNSPNLIFHVGHFPETAKDLETAVFALVHIDADLYLPVKEGLEFFYPRLAPGGVLMVHDYTHKWEGLSKAVDDFVATIPENLVHVPDRFGTVMIIHNKS